MWCGGELDKDNPQLLTLVHGVDRKGRPVIRAYRGNARHPVYQEYQEVINKNYEKAARLSQFSRGCESPMYRVNNSSSDLCYSETTSASTSTPRTRATSHWTPSRLSGVACRSPTIVPEVKGMQAIISRLRSSLAIHAGLGPTSSEVNFLPVIPVRVRKPPSSNCLKNERPTGNTCTVPKKMECDSIKCNIVPEEKTLASYTESCGGGKGTFHQTRKVKKQKKKKTLRSKKLKPKIKPISSADIVPLNSINSKYLLS